MYLLNGNRIKLVLVGVVAVMVVGGGSARADFTFGEPTIVEGPINEDYRIRFIGCISADNLELYLDQHIGTWNSPTRWDIMVSTRISTDELWSMPVSVGATVNDGSFNYTPSISNDGLKLYYDSDRAGGHGGYDIWVTARPDKGANWGTPVNLGPSFNTSSDDGYPFISSDGQELYFSTNRPGGHGGWDIWVATRQTQDGNWGTPENLGPLVNKSADEGSPCLSPDGLKLFFDQADNMYMTQRTNIAEPWQAPIKLDQPLNSSKADLNPRVSPDGLILYFTSHRTAVYKLVSKGWHVWESPITPIVDLNGDGSVDILDVGVMVEYWGTNESLCDIGPSPLGDGVVDVLDLLVLAEYLKPEDREQGLIAHWSLDETQGSTARDSVSGEDAFVLGEPLWQPAGGMVDGALQLDGIDDCVITASGINPAEGPFSVLAWIKGGAPGQAILSQMGGANWICTDPSGGTLMTELTMAGRDSSSLGSEVVITDDKWHRIGFVWDGSHRTLYVDSIVVAEDMQDGLEGSTNGLYIGTGKMMQPGTYYSGLIDDVRIYNRVVSP